MKNSVIDFDKKTIRDMADRYFWKICSDSIEGEQKTAFLTEIEKAREHVLEWMTPKAIYSYYSMDQEFELKRGIASFSGEFSFRGGIFTYYNRCQTVGAITYLLTVGNLHKHEGMKLLTQYYIDAWGSAYVEAAHDLLKRRLRDVFCSGQGVEKRNCYVSEPFGPGYFGIDVKDTGKIFRMMRPELLNMTLSQGGMMEPEKSCCGFYVLTEENVPLPEDHCDHCEATGNCEYCRKKHV